MGIDLAALKAKLAAAAAKPVVQPKEEIVNETKTNTSILGSSGNNSTGPSSVSTSNVHNPSVVTVVPASADVPAVVFSNTEVIGTAKTTEIDHLDFLAKMNSLQQAIHKQHPTMPVLLMQIHKQLRADPELVGTLSEEAIGVIVKGLQIQTKTELVSVVVKESKSKKKKEPISLDMF